MKGPQSQKSPEYEHELFEFSATRGEHLFPFVRDLDTYNEQKKKEKLWDEMVRNERMIVLGGKSWIRCFPTAKNSAFLEVLAGRYTSGRVL